MPTSKLKNLPRDQLAFVLVVGLVALRVPAAEAAPELGFESHLGDAWPRGPHRRLRNRRRIRRH